MKLLHTSQCLILMRVQVMLRYNQIFVTPLLYVVYVCVYISVIIKYVCEYNYVRICDYQFLIFVVCSAEEDKPVVHIYDGRGCEKSAVTSLTHIHSSPIISMKV